MGQLDWILSIIKQTKNIRTYVGLFLAPVEGFSLWQRVISGQKPDLVCMQSESYKSYFHLL